MITISEMTMDWSLHSPDITPSGYYIIERITYMFFFFGAFAKIIVYITPVYNMNTLKRRTQDAALTITGESWPILE